MSKMILIALSALAGGAAFAQGEGRAAPAEPGAAVPATEYRSAFEDYRPYAEQELASWRAVNDEVARVGGHVGVLKAGRGAETGQEEEDKARREDSAQHLRHGSGQ